MKCLDLWPHGEKRPSSPSFYILNVRSLTRKRLLQKAATSKRYSPLGIELKKQNDIAKQHYKGLQKVVKFEIKEGGEKINRDDKNEHLKSLTNQI